MAPQNQPASIGLVIWIHLAIWFGLSFVGGFFAKTPSDLFDAVTYTLIGVFFAGYPAFALIHVLFRNNWRLHLSTLVSLTFLAGLLLWMNMGEVGFPLAIPRKLRAREPFEYLEPFRYLNQSHYWTNWLLNVIYCITFLAIAAFLCEKWIGWRNLARNTE